MARRASASNPDLSTPEGRIAARMAAGKGPKAAAPKAKPAKTVVEPIELQQIHSAQEEEPDLIARCQKSLDDLVAKLGAASPTRYLCSAVLALAAATGIGYLLSQVLMYLMVAVAIGTGSSFLVYAVAVLGTIIGAVLGYKTAGAVFNYVVTGRIDAHWNATKAAVGSFFSAKPVTAA
jgi:hypothetical protein